MDDADARVDRLTRELVAADERAVAQRVALETAQRRVAKETNRADAAAKTAARRTGELEDAREEIATLRAAVRLAGGGAAEEREEEREASRRVDRVSRGGDANAARAETERVPAATSSRKPPRGASSRKPPSVRGTPRTPRASASASASPFHSPARRGHFGDEDEKDVERGRGASYPDPPGARLGVPVPPGSARSSVSSARGLEHTRSALDAEMENATALLEAIRQGRARGRVVGGVDAIVVAGAVGALGRRRVVSRMVSETGKEGEGKDFGVGEGAMMVV